MGTDLNIGHATAYAYAKSKGYTGTEEQFATELAQFAQNAQKVAEDRAAVEQLVNEFLNTTAPAVIQDVTDEGTSQVERVAGAGTAQVTRVGEAGNTQIDAVASAGTTQIGLVTDKGTEQVTRVQDKGDEVIDSIPADYTALTQEVSDLNRQINSIDEELNETTSITVYSISDNYRLNETDGLCTRDYSYKLHKFPVEVGKNIAVTTTDRWMFNTNTNVPTSGDSHMVGAVHSGSGEAVVPVGAGYLIVSAPNAETPSAAYVEHKIPAFEEEIEANATALKTNAEPTLFTSIFQMENAYWQNADTFKPLSYRAGCMTPLSFDRDVVITCTKDCYISGYLDDVYIGTVSTITVPKNSVLKLYVRRYVEDSSATESVSELTAGLFILNYYSCIIL